MQIGKSSWRYDQKYMTLAEKVMDDIFLEGYFNDTVCSLCNAKIKDKTKDLHNIRLTNGYPDICENQGNKDAILYKIPAKLKYDPLHFEIQMPEDLHTNGVLISPFDKY